VGTLDVASQLASFRQTIDNIDAALVYILAERFRCTNEIGLLKAEHDLPPADKSRQDRQLARLRDLAENARLEPEFVDKLMHLIFSEVVRQHEQTAAMRQARQPVTK
jgi:chorismate mutase